MRRMIQRWGVSTSGKWRLTMANVNPLLGIGHNAYNVAYDTYDFSMGEYGRGRSVHSSFFGILAEAGYLGFVLFAVILVFAFRSCSRVRKHAAMGRIPGELGHGAIALEASLVVFVVGGMFLPFQYNEMFWHFIGLTIVLRQLADQHMVAPRASPSSGVDPQLVAPRGHGRSRSLASRVPSSHLSLQRHDAGTQ